uniref:Acylamino-acid-releasing enzyme (Trinotate prediction) n=1 Tax=Myxobolus squamalis TaxID=59785 RepID=A0A6B2G470_MYXSQ
MYSGTDIPEWVLTETGGDYSSTLCLDSEKLSKLYKSSPIFYADCILCPVLLLLGSEDKRVPMQQGMLLYRTLKSRKANVNVHVYKDFHALDSVDTERSCAYEITHFLLKHAH